MSAYPFPEPIKRLQRATMVIAGWAVILGWAYFALLLAGLAVADLPRYASMPAVAGLREAWRVHGLHLFSSLVALTLVRRLAVLVFSRDSTGGS